MAGYRSALPRYNIKRIIQVRDMLVNDTFSDYLGFAPTGESFEELVDRLCDAFSGVSRQVMWDSVRYVAGALLSEEAMRNMVWRLAGNIRRLRDGQVVPPWHLQTEKEWMPVQIIAYQPEESARGRRGGRFTMRVLAGTACPLRLSKFWPRGFARYIALGAGYSRGNGEFRLGDISELVNLRLWIRIDPELCRPGLPGFDEVGCTAGLLKWNREIIKKRFRRGFICPYHYDHHCFKCHVGYLQCPAATHKETVDVGREDAGEGEDRGDRDGAQRNHTDGPSAGAATGRPHVLAGDLQPESTQSPA